MMFYAFFVVFLVTETRSPCFFQVWLPREEPPGMPDRLQGMLGGVLDLHCVAQGTPQLPGQKNANDGGRKRVYGAI